MTAREITAREISEIIPMSMPRFKLWRQRGLVAAPYDEIKTLSLALGSYFANRGIPFEMVRNVVSLVASKTKAELLEHFRHDETRLTLDTDTKEVFIESPAKVAERAATGAGLFSIPLRTSYELTVQKLNSIQAQ